MELRDQERGSCDLWALTPAAQISGSVVQLHWEEVRGNHYNEGHRGRAGTGGEEGDPQPAPQWREETAPSLPPLPLVSVPFLDCSVNTRPRVVSLW